MIGYDNRMDSRMPMDNRYPQLDSFGGNQMMHDHGRMQDHQWRIQDHGKGRSFYLTCMLQHEDKENHRNYSGTMNGHPMESGMGVMGSMLSDMFKTVTGAVLGEDKMNGQMIEVLERAIIAVLRDKGYAANVAPLYLPPLAKHLKANTTFSGEKIFVFQVKLHRRESVNKDGLFFIQDFQCCQHAIDFIVPLSSECQQLSRTVPLDLMNELRAHHRMYVRCEGATCDEQTGHLMRYGWSPEAIAMSMSWGAH
eukprot:gnl/TRDRNA2_/TRDRNA2_44510_c0_seq1.p1 gnl/TRDRNA2_/TRDRNA2_44510_c0~~gnl/TRDRNA2_/TRDRNA2_44510_c0_seq1.p1  ORF type:complete len:252 (-),score=45.58 gnl/TRDRNA2_/TRDRNA2_44510_c0_seq1:83-838(-)